MRRLRLTITLKKDITDVVDKLIDGQKLRNRSHAIEYILTQYFKPSVSKAVILAGGQGTKMRPYTYEMPKALLPIKGKPILEHLIENLKKSGIYDIIICIGHLGDKIKDYFGNGSRFGVNIIYSEEKKTLETGGAIKKVKNFLSEDPFLVIHGDILFDLNLVDILDFHKVEGLMATAALTTENNAAVFGRFKLHGIKIEDFLEKPKKNKLESYLVNAGVYVFDKKIFDYFPKEKENFLLEDILRKLIQERQVAGFVFSGKWFDVGTLENYEKAIKSFSKSGSR